MLGREGGEEPNHALVEVADGAGFDGLTTSVDRGDVVKQEATSPVIIQLVRQSDHICQGIRRAYRVQ